jgi:hypothetical protein
MDVVVIVTVACAAAGVIVFWHADASLATTAMAVLMGVLLRRFHAARDVAGAVAGATIGNAIELACDAAGVWQHADRSLLNLAPSYILLCYPILGFAIPRLVDALAGHAAPCESNVDRGAAAAALLLAFVLLSLRFGQDPVRESAVCVIFLGATLWQFHSRHDAITATAGMIVALVWEVPATISGAWRFPTPQVFGLLPGWLPLAYAIFFVTMRQLTDAAAALRSRRFA